MGHVQAPDLNRVSIFLKVVEAGGFTAAARELGLPKSSVSRAVALLEQELRARLLRRTSRKVTATEAGAAFYERASRGMALLGEAREAVTELHVELRGPIRVTTAVDLAVWRLAPVIAAFVELHPAVLIDVVLTGRTVDLLEEGFDFAIRAGSLRDENLVARKLPAAEFALYALQGLPRTTGRPSARLRPGPASLRTLPLAERARELGAAHREGSQRAGRRGGGHQRGRLQLRHPGRDRRSRRGPVACLRGRGCGRRAPGARVAPTLLGRRSRTSRVSGRALHATALRGLPGFPARARHAMEHAERLSPQRSMRPST